MARNVAMYKVKEANRDKGKTFLITEMPAMRGEAWAMRALLGIMSSGANLPDNFTELGMAGLAEMGFKSLAGIRWEMLEPLLQEMFETVQFVGDPAKAFATTRPLIDDGVSDDIEEISTRLQIRKEWWNLHMGFFMALAPSLFERAKAMAGKSSRTGTSAK